MRRRVAWVAAVALLAAGCAGPAAQSDGDPTFTAPQPRHPQLEPCRLPASRSDLPSLQLPCLTAGQESTLVDPSRLGGQPTLVNLWASWCIPCQREMPALQRGHVAAGGKAAFLGVETKDEKDSGQDFLAVVGVTYPQAQDPDGRLLAALHGVGLPVTVMLDRDGKVVWRKLGRLKDNDLQEALTAAGLPGVDVAIEP